MDAVSEVLSARAQEAEGLSSMLGASALAHLALLAVALSWLPEINPVWGLTALQVALIGVTGAILYSLLAPAAKDLRVISA